MKWKLSKEKKASFTDDELKIIPKGKKKKSEF